MALRILAAGAALSLLAGPAWAACTDDIEALDEQVVAAETGAPEGDSEMPTTQHQAEVLSGDAQSAGSGAAGSGAAAGAGSAAESEMPATEHQQQVLSGEEPPMETGAGAPGDVEAASPHQREVVREIDDDSKAQASTLLDEARQLAEAGDEAGCQAKVTEAEALLGGQ